MRKRTRRGRGRGRRAAASFVEVNPGGHLDSTVTPNPGWGEDAEMDDGELVVPQTEQRDRTSDVPVNSYTTESQVDANSHASSGFVVTPTLPSPPSNANSNARTTVSSSCSSSSIDGDGASDAGDNEQMHTGFMQMGPSNYRVGSTIVNLSNCSEDDVTPEFRQNDICLQVECGDNKALMYMSKLYQGSKGKCIELDGKWFTPNEFQAISGRESAKDWKRSIRHHGRSLKLLLSKNVLDVHPAACRCDSCSQLQQLNGKTGSSGDANKVGSGGDTSSEDNKKSCNGAAGVKKRKKGKQPGVPAAAKMAKMTATVAANTTTKLEPIGITIPKTPEKPQEDEDKIIEIPNMDSPLFKDVPSKKKLESSSDCSSSSGDSSTSDDSSSSDDDSDEEEEEKKDTDISGNIEMVEDQEEPPKARTPIKLTISNLGKPSAKVTSTASRELIESNSSDSDTDVDDHELQKEFKEIMIPVKENVYGNPMSSHISTLSVQHDINNEPLNDVNDTNVRNKGILQQPNHTERNILCKDVGDVREHCKDKDLLSDSVMNFHILQSETSHFDVINDKILDRSGSENSASNDIHEKGGIAIDSTKDSSELFKKVKAGADFENSKHQQCEFLNKDDISAALPAFQEPTLKKTDIKTELNSALLRDSLGTKYCPDGFILAPTLSKSPQHLKATVNIPQPLVGSDVFRDDKDGDISHNEESSQSVTLDKTDTLDSSEDDSKQTVHGITNQSSPKDSVVNSAKINQSLPEDGSLDNFPCKDTSDRESLEKKNDVCEIKDQNLNIKITNSNNKDDDKSVVMTKADVNSTDGVANRVTTESVITNTPKSKDTAVTSLSLSRNTTTKMTSALTTFTTNSGSITSPSSRSCGSKGSGFTNGIPDNENPFITWTKYDNDNSGPVSTALPTSSLVQALARAPFPPLALPGESPIPQISPLGGAVPQLSPLSLAGLSPGSSQLSRMSPGSQMPRLSSPTSHRLRSSPSHSTIQQQLSPPLGRPGQASSCDGSKLPHGEDSKVKSAPKSVKRTSRLSNIIDSLRTSKEKEAAGSSQSGIEVGKKGTLDVLLSSGKKSPLLESSSVPGQKSSLSSSSSSPVFTPSLAADQRSQSDRLFRDSLGFPHQISMDTQHAIRSSLDAARAQTINNSFNALKDDLDKGKRMLENLELMKNGLLDPYKSGLSDQKSRKVDNSHTQNRSKSSSLLLNSSSAAVSSAPSSSSRPSSRQSTKLSSQSYPSTSPSSSSTSSSRPNTITTTSSNNFSSSGSNSINSAAMFQAAPSAALAAAHMELNAAAANILAFQHMYGMQDPYMMKTLMSNPLYLQRMMEFQKQAMDPLMLRQLEMFEAAAVAEKSKNKDQQRAAMNAQSILWQAQAASILQHQQMQQFQQLQLHHQQQLQQQAAAVRERETRETIAAIMASKSSNLSTHTNKSSGSISTGQSAKSLMASAVPSSSSSSSSKRPRPLVPQSPSDIYSRDGASLEKKLRSSHQTSSHVSNHTSYHPSLSTSSSTTSSSSSKHVQMSSKPTSSASSSIKQHSGSSGGTPSLQSKHELFELPSALHLSAATSPNLWGFPTILQPPSVDMARMSRYFERPNETPSSSSSSAGPVENEATGAEVLDLSVKPRTGKT